MKFLASSSPEVGNNPLQFAPGVAVRATMEIEMDNLENLRVELKAWEWGLDDNKLISGFLEEVCVHAGLIVLEQLSQDLTENEGGSVTIGEDGDIFVHKCSGDHFEAKLNVSKSLRFWMEPNSIDNDARRIASAALRQLADEMDRAIEADPDNGGH